MAPNAVAIKLWKTSGPGAEAALLAEAKTLAKLSHPNVVTVFAVGRNEDNVYFVMEANASASSSRSR